MEVHVLNGDALREHFPKEGKIIICRECMIEGPVQQELSTTFWNNRSRYLAEAFNSTESFYIEKVKPEIEKLLSIPSNATINLWFEHDLFCQTNLWFIIHLLKTNKIFNPLFRVMPPSEGKDVWSGFGAMNAEQLDLCFSNRVAFTESDIKLALGLWNAYCTSDFATLMTLSQQPSSTLLLLKEVCQAHVDRFGENYDGRPQQRLREITQQLHTKDFKSVFEEFSKTEGVYGFGNLQVKRMLSSIS